jgi:hypothetical protein
MQLLVTKSMQYWPICFMKCNRLRFTSPHEFPPYEFQFPVRIQKSCESSRYIAVRSTLFFTNDATVISQPPIDRGVRVMGFAFLEASTTERSINLRLLDLIEANSHL